MNNVEKAKEIAFDYFLKEELTINSRIEAALRMAQWKDEQFNAEKQALIDKACEWLNTHDNYSTPTHVLVEQLRQAMKGGKL